MYTWKIDNLINTSLPSSLRRLSVNMMWYDTERSLLTLIVESDFQI